MASENIERPSAMACWHYICPLIPVTDDPMSISIYVNTFKAFQLLDEYMKELDESKDV